MSATAHDLRTYGRLNAIVLVLAVLAATGWLTDPWLGLA